MSTKNREKQRARELQALSGLAYSTALHYVRKYPGFDATTILDLERKTIEGRAEYQARRKAAREAKQGGES